MGWHLNTNPVQLPDDLLPGAIYSLLETPNREPQPLSRATLASTGPGKQQDSYSVTQSTPQKHDSPRWLPGATVRLGLRV